MIENKFNVLKKHPSDINEHLSVLSQYASECNSVLELGVRGVVSSWAFAHGLMNNKMNDKLLICNDIYPCNISDLITECKKHNICVKYEWCSDLDLNFEDNSIDLVFIDTFHVYGQLKRELEKFGTIARKYIIMHDTTIDDEKGEAIRCNFNINALMKTTGFSQEELTTGLRPAITEFLRAHPEWKTHEVFTHNNGLTILKKTIA